MSAPREPTDRLDHEHDAASQLAARMVHPDWDHARDRGTPPDEAQSERERKRWADELGIAPELLDQLVEQRRALVDDVADDPRAWGFDLVPRDSFPRDVIAEFRARTRTGGFLAQSFITGHRALVELVPDPLTLPDGRPLPDALVDGAKLPPEAAGSVAAIVRSVLQARLGRPLEAAAVEDAVREASWEQGFDAVVVAPLVLEVMSGVV